MPYKNSEDKINRERERRANRTEEEKEKHKEYMKQYNQRPEVKEKYKQYQQVQKFKKRQEIGEERWYKRQIDGFNLSCIMDYCNTINDGDYKTYKHSRNHELLYLIHNRNLAYNNWLKMNPPQCK